MFSKLPLCLQDSAGSLDMFKFKLYKWLMLHNHNPFYDIGEDNGEANRLLICGGRFCCTYVALPTRGYPHAPIVENVN